MLVSLKEAHNCFIKTHSEYKIALIKFCELRPKNIKLFDHIPHNVCICCYHENVRLLLQEHTRLCTDFQGFIGQVTYNSSQKPCMSNECSYCRNKINDFTPADAIKCLSSLGIKMPYMCFSKVIILHIGSKLNCLKKCMDIHLRQYMVLKA